MNFSKNLKKIRLDKGLSQEVVANELNITRQGYANYEKGTSSPTLDSVEKIADALDVDMDYLLFKDKIDSLEDKKLEFEKRLQRLELSSKYNFDMNDEESYKKYLKIRAKENEEIKNEIIQEIHESLQAFNYSGIVKIKDYIDDLSSIKRYRGIDEALQFYYEDDWLEEFISETYGSNLLYPKIYDKWDKIFLEYKDKLTVDDILKISSSLNKLLEELKKRKED